MIRSLTLRLDTYFARRKLEKLVRANRSSPATKDYAKRRSAALLGIMRRKMRDDLRGVAHG